MSNTVLGRYVRQLDWIFKASRDKRVAHVRSQDVLREMSGDPAVLPAIFRRHMETPGTWDTRHYPVVGMNVELNPHYNLVANCWVALPGGETNVSTKAIHHHGELLMTTVTAFGPGYEHWTFRPAELIDEAAELYALRLTERAGHPLHHVAFVDSCTPHLPMYPASLSVTLALWSGRKPTTWKDRVKRVPALKRNEAALRALAQALGLAKALDIKVVEYFDFYPVERGFKGMRERVEFARGPNEDYLHSLFHILQRTGNEGLAPVVRRQLDSGAAVENPGLAQALLDDLVSGRPIEGRFSVGHLGVPHANFTAEDVERALGTPRARAAAAGTV
jgi:hypothetical protein